MAQLVIARNALDFADILSNELASLYRFSVLMKFFVQIFKSGFFVG